jgi:hypothetical protein
VHVSKVSVSKSSAAKSVAAKAPAGRAVAGKPAVAGRPLSPSRRRRSQGRSCSGQAPRYTGPVASAGQGGCCTPPRRP